MASQTTLSPGVGFLGIRPYELLELANELDRVVNRVDDIEFTLLQAINFSANEHSDTDIYVANIGQSSASIARHIRWVHDELTGWTLPLDGARVLQPGVSLGDIAAQHVVLGQAGGTAIPARGGLGSEWVRNVDLVAVDRAFATYDLARFEGNPDDVARAAMAEAVARVVPDLADQLAVLELIDEGQRPSEAIVSLRSQRAGPLASPEVTVAARERAVSTQVAYEQHQSDLAAMELARERRELDRAAVTWGRVFNASPGIVWRELLRFINSPPPSSGNGASVVDGDAIIAEVEQVARQNYIEVLADAPPTASLLEVELAVVDRAASLIDADDRLSEGGNTAAVGLRLLAMVEGGLSLRPPQLGYVEMNQLRSAAATLRESGVLSELSTGITAVGAAASTAPNAPRLDRVSTAANAASVATVLAALAAEDHEVAADGAADITFMALLKHLLTKFAPGATGPAVLIVGLVLAFTQWFDGAKANVAHREPQTGHVDGLGRHIPSPAKCSGLGAPPAGFLCGGKSG